MIISSFINAQCKGHMNRVKRIYAYLDKTSNAYIQVITEEADYSALLDQKFDWE